jgi:hypothetical protein
MAVLSAVAALAAGYALATVPPPAVQVRAPWQPRLAGRVLKGAFHVHTRRSDGSGSLDSVAAAAARAGLDVVIFTDHGDGVRPAAPPSYRAGVLCIDGVEVSTTGGHYAALGARPSPYPLGGDAAGVVDDVRRLGGLGVVTHPDSPKRALLWRDWDLPIDAFEWLSADSAWRDEPRGVLVGTALRYFVRGPEVIASLFDRPDAVLRRWDEAGGRGRRLVALAGLDAHARLGPRGTDNDEAGETGEQWSLPVPSYEVVFRTLSLRIEVGGPLAAHPEDDAARVIEALRRGHVFTVVDGLARPGGFEFFGETPTGLVRMGDGVPPGASSLRLHARTASPAGAVVSILANGVRVARGTGVELAYDVTPAQLAGPTMFRVEVDGPSSGSRRLAPTILSNGIFVGALAPGGGWAGTGRGGTEAGNARDLLADGDRATWAIERDPGSRGAFERLGAGGPAVFTYALDRDDKNAWSALVVSLGRPVGEGAVLRLRARAAGPLRLSVQVRASADQADLRWRRSVYLDETARTVEVPVGQMAPVRRGVPEGERPRADAILFVVDRVNAPGGAAGTIWIDALELRPQP